MASILVNWLCGECGKYLYAYGPAGIGTRWVRCRNPSCGQCERPLEMPKEGEQ